MIAETELQKRYWVFEEAHYYPIGGLGDVGATFDYLASARSYVAKSRADEVSIFDSNQRKEIPNS